MLETEKEKRKNIFQNLNIMNCRFIGRMKEISFEYIGGHLIEIPVKVHGHNVKFLLDTGIGPTVISSSFSEELSLKRKGETSGQRMSGQEISIPLVEVPSAEVGGIVRNNLEVGLFDMSDFPDFMSEIKGILSIGYFSNWVVTFDYSNNRLLLCDHEEYEEKFRGGSKVPITVEYKDTSVSVFIKAILPTGRSVQLEVDTGSDVMILNRKYMNELGVSSGDSGLQKLSGKDETGHEFERFFADIKGDFKLEGAPDISQNDPKVMFQDIIYDGLLGNDFLKRFTVSYDLSNSNMVFHRSSGMK